jgi:lipopolysaccharide export system ATP-binding protein
MGSTLAAMNLEKSYRNKKVVKGVSVSLSSGEVVGLLGPNGAGKTTTFYMISGLIRPSAGSIQLNGKDITRWPIHRRARAGIGYLPQESSIFRGMSVDDNLLAVMEAVGISKVDRAAQLMELKESMGITHLGSTMGGSLSGGERRRAEIARALIPEPAYLLLDEPFAGIDPITVLELQKLLRGLKESGLGILITDHNVRETLGITDRAYILAAGTILEEGTPDAIINSERARKVYLGEGFSL